MKRFLSEVFLKTNTHIEDHFALSKPIDPKIKPKTLLDQLKTRQGLKNFIHKLNQKERGRAKILHKLILMHWCLIYDPSLCDSFKAIDFKNLSGDEWLNTHLFKPYNRYIQQICYSKEMYETLRLDHILVFSFDRLFVIRKLLVCLFSVVKKIDGLELYYDNEKVNPKEKENKTKVRLEEKHITEFVSMISFHAQELYAIFKAILGEMLRFPDKYLETDQKRDIIKYILKNELEQIN